MANLDEGFTFETRGGARDAEDAQAVPVSVLSRRSGVPIATIKYYIREGLIR